MVVFLLAVKWTASLADHQEWRGSLCIDGRVVPLDEIRAIYYRRSTGFRLPGHLSPEQQRFAKAEAQRGLGGLLLTLPVLTVVGDKFFAVAIHANSPEAYSDWRSDYSALAYEPIETPVGIRRSITVLLERLGLSFGAFDFTVTPDDEWVFLEINPNGQWGWIEERTGLPITFAIADLLANGDIG